MIDLLFSALSRSVEDLFQAPGAWVAAAVIGGLAVAVSRLHDRIARLEREVSRLRYSAMQEPAAADPAARDVADCDADRRDVESAPVTGAAPAGVTARSPGPAAGSAAGSATGSGAGTESLPAADANADADADTPPAPSPAPARAPSAATTTPFVEPAAGPGWFARVLGGGNWLVRSGIVLLFIGVGFLLKLAADHALLPVELRLAAVGAGGIALVLLGLKLAPRRRAYALALQGGGVGLLYLTLYAAFRLYDLLPAGGAFALMTLVVAAAGWLAWRQDALVLAVLGALGGFAAPVLASTGSGSHVALFSYYAVLDLGVLGLAFARSWRALNLVGFAATFVISALWGARFYEPQYFASVEPFLVLFFVLYVAVAILFARHRRASLADPLDATLIFGTPLVAFGLQSRLVADFPHGLTVSAAVLTGFYALLWHRVRGRDVRDLAVLGDAFAALAVGFATVTVALAFDARWTSAAWALEGAAMVWVGWRQRRVLARLAGAALQLAAGAAWLWHAAGQSHWERGEWFGSVTLAVAGLVSSAVLARPCDGSRARDERPLGVVLGLFGLLAWAAGTTVHLAQWLDPLPLTGALLLVAAASAVVLEQLGARLHWTLARVAARALPPVLVVLALAGAVHQDHALQSLSAAGWPVAFATVLWVLRRQHAAGGVLLRSGHVLWLWLLAALAAWELAWLFEQVLPPVQSWQRLAWVLAPAAVVAAVASLAGRRRPWPFPEHAALYLGAGSGPLVCIIGGGLFALGIGDPHAPWPIAYVPLLNPLDLGLALAAGACLLWVSRARALLGTGPRNLLLAAGAGLAFVWLNGALLRTLHFWADIAYRPSAFFHSTVAQTSVSVLWAVTGLVVMVGASRVAGRALWMLGAALMGIVAVKLILVDLASSGAVARVVSFISVGLLMMLVGYLAPVPPRER